MQLNFYSDAGHGWLKVSRKVLKDLGIEKLITGFSYQKDNNVYLEEDLDMTTFIDALKEHHIEYTINEIEPVLHSRIRYYQPYRSI